MNNNGIVRWVKSAKTLSLNVECLPQGKTDPADITNIKFELRMKHCEDGTTPPAGTFFSTSPTGTLGQFSQVKLNYYGINDEVLKFSSPTATSTLLWKNRVMAGPAPHIEIEEMAFLNSTGFEMKMNCPLDYSLDSSSASYFEPG